MPLALTHFRTLRKIQRDVLRLRVVADVQCGVRLRCVWGQPEDDILVPLIACRNGMREVMCRLYRLLAFDSDLEHGGLERGYEVSECETDDAEAYGELV